MSLVQTFHLQVEQVSASASPVAASRMKDVRVSSTSADAGLESSNAALDCNSTPRPAQPIFERAPLIQIAESRRVAIIILLVLANLVQVQLSLLRYHASSAKIRPDDCQLCRTCRGEHPYPCDGGQTDLRLMDRRELCVSKDILAFYFYSTSKFENNMVQAYSRDIRACKWPVGGCLWPSIARADRRWVADHLHSRKCLLYQYFRVPHDASPRRTWWRLRYA